MKKILNRNIAAIVALLLLAFAASYGVYTFQLLFVPWWVALASAASFEATYIGLALAMITTTNKKRAAIISIAAVVVSITYNSVSALFHLDPTILAQDTLWLNIPLAILHGLPLALVAYCVADLIIHQQQTPNKDTSKIQSKGNLATLANTQANDVANNVARVVAKPVVERRATSRANITAKGVAKPKGRFVCSQCGYKAKNAKALNGHMTKHRNDKLS